MFHGSYKPKDVTFLMRVVNIEETPIDQKELFIQSKKYHYSELISPEYRPDKKYLDLFYDAMDLNVDRIAKELFSLASYISSISNPVIVSLARAGTPVGVVLRRMLASYFNMDISHYSISIIKDRGIDESAIMYILKNHPDSNLVFVDGWVSKGSIAKELKKSIEDFNFKYNLKLNGNLHALSDISGNAFVTVTNDDYLIPSAILNSVISGLISRSIYTSELASDGGFHGCKYYHELTDIDLSLWYVEKIMKSSDMLSKADLPIVKIGGNEFLKKKISDFINKFVVENNVKSIELIKPGIAEATRALLRRVPKLVIANDITSAEIKHVLHLCSLRNVEVKQRIDMPFKVMAVL